jgi:hypothetical protein
MKESCPEGEEHRGDDSGMHRARKPVDEGVGRDDKEENDGKQDDRRDAVDHAAMNEAADAEDMVAEDRIGEGRGDNAPQGRGDVRGQEAGVRSG